MLMQAPGKLVLSGAYAVLEGAPALVSAVNRYAIADSTQRSSFTTPEYAATGIMEAQPLFDASELRAEGEKLGLGSSAAILVACLGAVRVRQTPQLSLRALRRQVFDEALASHQAAQGGGSGVDVAASSFGGYLLARRGSGSTLELEPVEPNGNLVLSVWATGRPASTSELLRSVFQLKQTSPHGFARAMDLQREAAEQAAEALGQRSTEALLAALARQHDALDLLGREAGVEIVVDAVRQLHALARRSGAVVLPSGAGGGDISFYAGLHPPSPELVALAGRLGQKPLDLAFGAKGLGPTTRKPRDRQSDP